MTDGDVFWLVIGVCLALIVVGLIRHMVNELRATRCYGGGKLHQFESRYDEVQVPRPADYHGPPGGVRGLNMQQVYVRDVCIWCGASADRPKAEAQLSTYGQEHMATRQGGGG